MVLKYINMITIVDVIDIVIVAFVIYRLILLIKETRAQTLVKGILLLVVVMQLSGWFGLNTINYLLQNMMQLSVFALLVVFQPEILPAWRWCGRSRHDHRDCLISTPCRTPNQRHHRADLPAAHSMSAMRSGLDQTRRTPK